MHPALASTNPFTTSAASVMRAVEPAAAPVTRPTPAAAAEPIAESSSQEGGDREAPAAPCLEHSPASGALDQVNHINEIFWFVRTKLMGQPRFVLDEGAFMAAIDEQPMFLRRRA